jgi:hypothetical protein
VNQRGSDANVNLRIGQNTTQVIGGPGEIRTHDLFHAMEATAPHQPLNKTYQFNKTPCIGGESANRCFSEPKKVVSRGGCGRMNTS